MADKKTPTTPPALPKTPPPGFGIPEKRGSIPGDSKYAPRRRIDRRS